MQNHTHLTSGGITNRFGRPVIALIAVMFGVATAAAETKGSEESDLVTVRGALVESAFHDEKPGPYNRIFDAITAGYEGELELSFAPHMRAINQVYFKQEYDCLFIGGQGYPEAIGLTANQFISSLPVATSYLRIFARRGDPMPATLDGMRGRRLAVEVATMDTMEDFGIRLEGLQVVLVPSAPKGFQLLRMGRFDYTVGYEQDMAAHFGRGFYRSFQKGPVIKKFDDVVNCWRSPRTEAFIKHLNSRITRLEAAGFFRALFRSVPGTANSTPYATSGKR